MDLVWARHAWDDYVTWQDSEPEMATKINELLKEIRRRPFAGIGKPEPLRGDLPGWPPSDDSVELHHQLCPGCDKTLVEAGTWDARTPGRIEQRMDQEPRFEILARPRRN